MGRLLLLATILVVPYEEHHTSPESEDSIGVIVRDPDVDPASCEGWKVPHGEVEVTNGGDGTQISVCGSKDDLQAWAVIFADAAASI